MDAQHYALIVDDNDNNLAAMAALLRREHITAVMLKTPCTILANLHTFPKFEVIFLDLAFPNCDGLKVIKDLKADARLNGIPIVAYSVHTSELNEARDAGFDSFLGKPISVEHFPEQLRHILSGKPVWEA